jgi:hypothetical protein
LSAEVGATNVTAEVCPLATFASGHIRTMSFMMAEQELRRNEDVADEALPRYDRVMERLARLLAESTAPPCPKTQLIEELLSGNFDAMFGGDTTGH